MKLPNASPSSAFYRAQSSIELLILFAALFAFLAVFIPIINQGRALSGYAIASRLEYSAFNRLAEAASQASLLGNGNSFTIDFTLAANETLFAFDEFSQELSINFSYANHSARAARRLGFPLSISPGQLSKGNWRAVISCENSLVAVDFKRQE